MTLNRRRVALGILAAVAGTLLFITLFSASSYRLKALEVTLRATVSSQGLTEISISPLGEIRARTHLPPFKLQVALKNVDVDLLRQMVRNDETSEQILAQMEQRLRVILGQFVLRLFILAALGGSCGPFLLGRRNWRDLLLGAVVGLILAMLLVGASFQVYDFKAFREPQYTGILKAAPWMVGVIEESMVKVKTLGEKLEVLADNLYDLFRRIDRLEPLGVDEATTRVLLVSDLHNNPAALDFVKRVVSTFDVHFVIDAGDATDFGTVFEAVTLERLVDLGVPYLIAPGNHESSELLDEISQLPNVIVLDNRTATVEGVTVLGSADPSSRTMSPALPSTEAVQGQVDLISSMLEESNPKPFVLVVHNPLTARPFAGKVPVIVSGHTHRFSIQVQDSTLFLNPGTTGGAGIRGLQARTEVPYSLILLHLGPTAKPGPRVTSLEGGNLEKERSPELRVLAVDSIKVFNLKAGFILERTLNPLASAEVDAAAVPAEAAPGRTDPAGTAPAGTAPSAEGLPGTDETEPGSASTP